MSGGSFDIGTVTGVIQITDKFTKVIDDAAAKVGALPKATASAGSKISDDTDKIAAQFRRVAASLDPTIAAHQKFETAVGSLGNALGKGLVPLSTHNELIDKAKEKYLHSAEGGNTFSAMLSKITELAGQAGGPMKEVAEGVEGVGAKFGGLAEIISSLGPLAPVIAGLAVALVGVGAALAFVDLIKESVSEAMKLQETIVQLNNALKQQGSASGNSAAELQEMAEKYALLSGREEAEVIKGELVFARFDKLGHEILPRATQAALDYAQATGKDVNASFQLVGQALEGNAKSLTKLKDVGIVFSSAQKKTLQDMVDTGNIAGYQAIVMGALEQKVGGAAAAYRDTLAGSISTAHAQLTEFKEAIGSEVIPALEALTGDIIKSLGGWDAIHFAVVGIGHDIGNFVRESIYGLIIAYHDMRADLALSVLDFKSGWHTIEMAVLSAIETILEGLSKLPKAFGGGMFQDELNAVRQFKVEADSAFIKSSAEWTKSQKEQEASSNDLTVSLLKHTQALAGDEEVQKKHKSVLDEVAAKNGKAKAALDAAAKAVSEYGVKVSDTGLALQLHASETITLNNALDNGIAAYDAAKESIDRANAVQQAAIKITGEHRSEIQKLTDEMKGLLRDNRAADAAKIAAVIKTQNDQFVTQLALVKDLTGRNFDLDKQTQKKLDTAKLDLQFTHDLGAAQAELQDALTGTTTATTEHAIAIAVETQATSLGITTDAAKVAALTAKISKQFDDIGSLKTQTELTKLLHKADADLAADYAKFADNQRLREATQQYGKDIADIRNKYGLLSTASRDLDIDERARAIHASAGNTRTLDDIRAELQGIEARRKAQAKSFADLEIQQAKAHQMMMDTASAMSAISDAFGGTSTSMGKLFSDLGKFVTALDQVASAAKGVQTALAAAAAINIGAALLKDFDVGGSNKTGGASQFGGRLESNFAGLGAAIGTALGAAIGTYFGATAAGAAIGSAIGSVIGGLISHAGDSASASLTMGGNIKIGETSDKLDGAVKDALLNIFKGLSDEMAKLGLILDGMPLIDIKIRDNIVRVVVGNVVRTFSNVNDAISFGIAEAIKQIGSDGKNTLLPPEVLQALKNTTATDMTALQSDLDFAAKVANYGVAKVVQVFNTTISSYSEEMNRAVQLGIDTTKITQNFLQNMQQARDQLLGINRALSPQDQLKSDVKAYNDRAELVIAQEQLEKADLLSKEADLKGRIALAKASVNLDRAMAESNAANIKAMEATLSAYDTALATIDGILAGVQLITDKELQEALKHIHGVGSSGPSAADTRAQMNAELEKLANTNLAQVIVGVIDLGAQLADLTKRTHQAKGSEEELAKARQALIDQQKLAIIGTVKDYLSPSAGGTYGMTDTAKKRADIEQTFADATEANRKLLQETGQRAVAFWVLNEARIRALHQLAEQEIASMNLPAEQWAAEVKTVADQVKDLGQSVQDGAISVDRFSQVIGELQDKTGSELLNLAEGILNNMGQTQEAAKVKAALDEANFDLQVAQLNFLYQQYLALGLISDAVKKTLDNALAVINNPANHPNFNIGPTTPVLSPADQAAAVAADKAMVAGASGGGSATGTDPVKAAIDLLNKYQSQGIDPLTTSLQQINTDFAQIRLALGNTPQVITQYNAAIQRAITQFLQPIQQLRQSLLGGNLSILDPAAKFAQAQADFLAAQQRFARGDLTVVSEIPNIVQNLLQQAQAVTPTGSQAYTDIFRQANMFLNQVLALDPNQVAGAANSNQLGATQSNPINVAGITALVNAAQMQTDHLSDISTATGQAVVVLSKIAATQSSAMGNAR